MKEVTLKPLYHRGAERIAVVFDYNAPLADTVKRLPEARWSQTHRCWHLPFDEAHYKALKEAMKEQGAAIDQRLLKAYLHKKKTVATTLPPNVHPSPRPAKLPAQQRAWKLCPANLKALADFAQQLKLRAYSPSTIKTYRNEFLQLLQLLKAKPVSSLAPDDLKRYMVYVLEKEGLSEATAHSRLNALKFYFEQVLGREKFFWEIPRPKKAKKLPNVLGEAEVLLLFRSLQNKKHQAILFTAYGAGLRVSEVVGLRLKEVDSVRMQLKVVAGKGKKDRYVVLSPIVLYVLRAYLRQAHPRPTEYVFESERPGVPYASRSAQKVFQRAKEMAGIQKEVSFHSLRHSFATHLLEKGVDIRYIKDLLGHLSILTTERYTHVSNKQLIHIKSPIDDLFLKGEVTIPKGDTTIPKGDRKPIDNQGIFFLGK